MKYSPSVSIYPGQVEVDKVTDIPMTCFIGGREQGTAVQAPRRSNMIFRSVFMLIPALALGK